MNIQNIPQYTAQNNYQTKANPHFKQNFKYVFDEVSGELKWRNSTSFFRKDLKWSDFIEMLTKNYANTDKVNVYVTGCSEGAEAYSLSMLLMEKLGRKDAMKFFPIHASDIDKEIIKNPRSGIVTPSKADIDKIDATLGGKYKHTKYMAVNHKYDFRTDNLCQTCQGEIKPILRDTVKFQNNSLKEIIPTINPDNSIVLCRNYWDYIPKAERKPLVERLYDRLGENSLCVIGDYDYEETEIMGDLLRQGFKGTDVRYCFARVPQKNVQASSEHWRANFIGA